MEEDHAEQIGFKDTGSEDREETGRESSRVFVPPPGTEHIYDLLAPIQKLTRDEKLLFITFILETEGSDWFAQNAAFTCAGFRNPRLGPFPRYKRLEDYLETRMVKDEKFRNLPPKNQALIACRKLKFKSKPMRILRPIAARVKRRVVLRLKREQDKQNALTPAVAQ